MKALLIAEKPSLKNDIYKVYNSMSYKDDITFVSLVGHVLELKNPKAYKQEWDNPWNLGVLPMIPERFEFEPKKATEDVYLKVVGEINSGKYDYIINACDAGREGELIFHSVYRESGSKLPVKRFWASDTTPATIERALNNLIDDSDNSLKALKMSSFFRAYFDWLLGMNLTRAVTLKANTLVNCGRVMTPTLNIIVQRELEITNFKPVDFWEIIGDFGGYQGLWFGENNETKLLDKKKAEAIISGLGKTGIVEDVTEEKEVEYAPTLHSLLELQKEANEVYGYTADRTLAIAQSLYETKKILSYPRTESRYLPKNLGKLLPEHLEKIKDIPELNGIVDTILADRSRIDGVLNSKKYVDDKKVTDHHAIIPTNIKPNLSILSQEERDIYTLVIKRFVAIFLDPQILNKTTIVTKVGDERFVTGGKTLVDLGYKVLYGRSKADVILPRVSVGQEVTLNKVDLITKQTTPPSRYNDSTLLKAMQNAGRFVDDSELKSILKETAGLGTSATRAEIIKKIVDREMVQRKGKALIPTQFGLDIIKLLQGQDIISPELTAVWEDKLKKVEDLSYSPKEFYAEMLAYTDTVTNRIKNEINHTIKSGKPGKENGAEVIGKCPRCGADFVVGAKYYLCSNYKNKDASKECGVIFGITMSGAKITKTEAKKVIAGKESKDILFTWKSGKSSNAKIYYNSASGKVEYLFPIYKK